MKIINIVWCVLFSHATALNGFWCCGIKEKKTPSPKNRTSTQLSTGQGSKRDLTVDIEESASATPPKQMVAQPAAGKDSPSSSQEEFDAAKFIKEITAEHETLLGGKTTLEIGHDDTNIAPLKALTEKFLGNVVVASCQKNAPTAELNKLLERFIQYKCLISFEELNKQRESSYFEVDVSQVLSSAPSTPGVITPRPGGQNARKHRFTMSSLTRPADTVSARKPSEEDESNKGV